MPSTPPEAAAARCRIEIDKLRKGFLAPASQGGREVVAVDDASFRIPQREAARVKPPVHPVRAAEAGLNVVWMAGFN